MKHEVEVKAKVADPEGLIARLGSLGCVLSEPIAQHDYIYNLKGTVLSGSHEIPVLRIREQGGRTIFTLKQNRSGELDCIEKETEVADGDAMRGAFELLGYEKSVEVEKARRKGKCGEYEICLDEVKGLGTFVEVEKMTEEDGPKVQKELFDFLVSLGVDPKDRVMKGYDSLIYDNRHEKR